jgi:hypothetical protein
MVIAFQELSSFTGISQQCISIRNLLQEMSFLARRCAAINYNFYLLCPTKTIKNKQAGKL